MNVWCPDMYTEAHRTPERQDDLVKAFRACGVIVDTSEVPLSSKTLDVVFCGSIFKAEHVRRHKPEGVPVVYYNWDLYSWVVENRPEMGWSDYLIDLNRADAVCVPNLGTDRRTQEMCGRGAVVVRAPVKVWEVPEQKPVGMSHLRKRSYAVDVMRDYPWDTDHLLVKKVCRKAGIPLLQPKTQMPWDEFRWYVANAAALISGVAEASTGGLTLLEGYAHGVPVLLNPNPLNGAAEYFESKAHYLFPDDVTNSAVVLSHAIRNRPTDVAHCRRWVEEMFSDTRFARELKEVFSRCLTKPTIVP